MANCKACKTLYCKNAGRTVHVPCYRFRDSTLKSCNDGTCQNEALIEGLQQEIDNLNSLLSRETDLLYLVSVSVAGVRSVNYDYYIVRNATNAEFACDQVIVRSGARKSAVRAYLIPNVYKVGRSSRRGIYIPETHQ